MGDWVPFDSSSFKSMTNRRTNGLTWVGARDTCVSKKKLTRKPFSAWTMKKKRKRMLSAMILKDSWMTTLISMNLKQSRANFPKFQLKIMLIAIRTIINGKKGQQIFSYYGPILQENWSGYIFPKWFLLKCIFAKYTFAKYTQLTHLLRFACLFRTPLTFLTWY